MFTGIITAQGTVREREATDKELALTLSTPYPADDLQTGESIACAGVCLTVTGIKPYDAGSEITVHLSNETLMHSAPQHWHVDAKVNLERALRAEDRLGGHFVSGHVDGKATIKKIVSDGESHCMELEVPEKLQYYIAPKGSVTLDGVSLTVNTVDKSRFTVMIIPHTWEHTTLAESHEGREVNLEVDLLARYLARLMEKEVN